jgi:recombination protein RecA
MTEPGDNTKKKKPRKAKAQKDDAMIVAPGAVVMTRRANFNPRELAGRLSESINKGRKTNNKQLTKLPIRSGGDSDNSDITNYISTGTSALDAPTGGGFACGRMSMVYGPESAGKSLLLESAILSAQERGGIGCVIDSEHTFNKARFTAKGGDIEAVMFIEAITLEDGFKYIEKTIKALIAEPMFIGKPIVVGWDTINTNQTFNKRSGNQYAGGMMEAPRVIWDGFRQLTEIIAESNIALIVLNQMYGDKIPPGGRALRYYASLMLYLEQAGELYESHRTGRNGKMLMAEVIKNKSNPPVDNPIFFACDSLGIDDTMSIFFNCRKRGSGKNEFDPKIFKSAGSWEGFNLNDGTEVKWQNEKGFYRKTIEHPNFVDELAVKLWEQWPPADPSTIKSDKEFVDNFGERNPWIVEDERYARCLISDHICPVAVWKGCRDKFWTACGLDLDDVEPLSRIYHCPPDLDGNLAAVEEELATDIEEEESD